MTNRRTSYKDLQLPEHTQAAVRLNNLLLNKTAGFSFTIDNDPECLFCIRMQPGNLDVQNICPISLTVEIGNTTAGLWLSDWPLANKISKFLPDGMLQELPENLSISVIESALQSLLYQAEKGLGAKLNIQSTSAEPYSLLYSMPLGFEMQVINPNSNELLFEGNGLLILDPNLYPHLQERLRHWPSDTNDDWEEHHTALWLEISRMTLTMQEINHLETDDLLLLEDKEFHDHGLIRLCMEPGHYCEATFDSLQKTNLTINTEWIPMTDNEQKQNVEHISQVPVQLSFNLGDKTLTFNEVRQLRPGYILELGKSLPEIVQIRSQNRLLGTGELVDIDGRVGVRILELFNKKAKGS